MKARLVNFLICIECGGGLQCQVEREDPTLPWREVLEGQLTCEQCGCHYPVSRGIPRLMRGTLPADVQNTVDGFGWEWEKFDEQIQDTHMTSEANFLDFIWPIRPQFFQGKVVLDAGCGMGRFLHLGATFGSQEIIGVDLSHSVEVAYQNVRTLPNAHVVQADIMALPFRTAFDYIFSVGVLQFLQDPHAGFTRLVPLLKPGGAISIWVYAREGNGWVVNVISPLRQHITSRLPEPLLYGLSRLLGLILYLAIRLLYKPANEGRLPFHLSRFLPYNEYLYYSAQLSYDALVSVVFDHLTPTLAHYLTHSEVAAWFPDEVFDDVHLTSRNGMSWRGTGSLRTSAETKQAITVAGASGAYGEALCDSR